MVTLSVLATLLLTLTGVDANTCHFSQEPSQLNGQLHWVLSDSPCLCATFRLGGVNTVPSQRPGDPVRFLDASLLRKRPGEIRDFMGCMTESFIYNTTAVDRDEIKYPFDPFGSALLVYIDASVSDLRVYLTTKELSESSLPYKIEFHRDELSVAKLSPRSPVYTDVLTESAPGSADGRHFWLYYRYDVTSAVIQIGLDEKTAEYTDHSPLQETTYLGTFSSQDAEWELRHYLGT